jgi:hypothetical protein
MFGPLFESFQTFFQAFAVDTLILSIAGLFFAMLFGG